MVSSLEAQIGGSNSNFSDTSDESIGIIEDTIVRPPLVYTYFTTDNIDERKIYSDTLFKDNFRNYDPAKKERWPYANLGNNGSASHSLAYFKEVPKAVDFGQHQFDPYKYGLEDLRLYTVNRAVSNLFFSNQGARENFFVGADFSRPFTDGSQLSLQYRRISQAGDYTQQTIKHTNLGLSFWYQNGRYQSIFSLLNNVETSENSGGVSDLENLTNPIFGIRSNIPVVLSSAFTRHQERALHYNQYLRLAGSQSGFEVRAHHHLEIGGGYFQFYDDNINSLADLEFYGDFASDTRGLRFDTEFTKLSNSFSLQGTKDNGLALDLGLSYDFTSIDEHPISSNVNDLFLNFKGVIPYKGQLLNTKAWIGLGSANATFALEGSLDLSLKGIIDLTAGIETYRHRPSRIANQLYVSEVLQWDNNLDKIFGTVLKGEFSIPSVNLSGTLRQTVENNSIYFGTDAKPRQVGDVYSATVLDFKHSIELGHFGMDNYFLTQVFSENVYKLPSFISKHNIYWEGLLIKGNLLGRLGIETTLVPTHEANAFMPLTGQFYQGEEETQFYPNTDIYFLAKVSDLRIFFKYENATDFLVDDIPFYVLRHPQNDGRFRFGFRWILKD